MSHRIEGVPLNMTSNREIYNVKSPATVHKLNNTNSIVDEKKREKKWSIGGLFRRRKKEVDSESSSEENAEHIRKGGFMARRKAKKELKKKKKPMLGTFDVVVTRNDNYFHYPDQHCDPTAVLSDPNTGFIGYCDRGLPTKKDNSVEENIDVLSKSSKESLNPGKDTSLGSSSLDSASRKSHRERAKARVEAKRDRIYNESSSDEGSQRSNSSSVAKFKSDDSISKSQRDSSLNRKTRGARTERYIKRITRDDEIQLNQEADQKHIKLNRVPNRSPSASPVLKSKHRSDNSLNSSISQSMISSSATIPPSHYPPNRILIEQQHNQHFNCPLQKPPTAAISSNRFMSQTHMHLHRTVPNEYYMPNQKSLSYENHINRTSQSSPINGNCVQRNLSLNQVYPPNHPRSPPPPPPRDPQRKLFSAACDNRPMSYAFENKHQRVNNQNNQFSSPQNVNRSSSIRSVNYPPTSKNNSYNWHQPYINFRSNSDDHVQQIITPHLQARPASVTSEIAPKRFITRRSNELSKYQYFTDKTPRSRKPIHISNATTVSENPYLSDSQVVTTCSYIDKHPVQLATEFWRQKEKEELLRKKLEIEKLHNEKKDLINKKNETVNLIKPTVIHQNITPSPLPNNVVNNSQINLKIIEKSDNSMMIPHRNTNLPGEKSNLPLKQGSNVHRQIEERSNISNRSCSRQSSVSSNGSLDLNNDNKEHSKRRKSTNLEDALDELEAIYKSLRLGDEDLLERAEERDLTVSQSKTEHYAKWNTSRGTQSDSGYNYTRDSSSVESLIDCDVPLRVSRLSRKPCNADKVADDMALRRLRKIDKSSNQESIPRSSYLLTSPALSDKVFNYDTIPSNDEPNIVLDDMMYRNMKHSINTLKINDPQPLFGIPLGPISPAPNSDYLHVIPENKYRSRFIPQKLPDVIKDDLAFRSLRKDHSKDTTLPSLSSDDFVNNNNNITKNENFSLKKKRAVRSLSANIYNLINRDIVKSPNIERQEFEKAQSFSDINDAIQMAQKILKDREVIGGKSCRISSNSPTSTETLTGSTILCGNSKSNQNLPLASDKTNLQQRLRVYIAPKSDDIVSQKPPLPQSLDRSSKPPTKESTPARISPDLNEHNTKMDKDKLQDILTALANEAHETSEKLELELEQMKVNSNQDTHSKDKIQHIENVSNTNTSKQIGYVKDVAEIVEPKTVSINTKENFINIDQKLSDIDAVSEHAKLCEKLLECVVESTELIGPKTLEIEKCFDNDSLELSFEEVEQFDKFEKPSQSVANIILTRNADLPSEILLDSVDSDRLSTEIICTKPESSYEDDGIVTSFSNESDIDSTLSEQNESKIKERNNSKSPFEIHKEALLHEFAELKKKLTENEYISETDIQYKKNYLYGNTNENSSQRNSYTIPNAVSPEENANNNLSSSPVENDIEMKRDTDVLIQFAELPKEDLNSSTNVNSEILQISSSSDSEGEIEVIFDSYNKVNRVAPLDECRFKSYKNLEITDTGIVLDDSNNNLTNTIFLFANDTNFPACNSDTNHFVSTCSLQVTVFDSNSKFKDSLSVNDIEKLGTGGCTILEKHTGTVNTSNNDAQIMKSSHENIQATDFIDIYKCKNLNAQHLSYNNNLPKQKDENHILDKNGSKTLINNNHFFSDEIIIERNNFQKVVEFNHINTDIKNEIEDVCKKIIQHESTIQNSNANKSNFCNSLCLPLHSLKDKPEIDIALEEITSKSIENVPNCISNKVKFNISVNSEEVSNSKNLVDDINLHNIFSTEDDISKKKSTNNNSLGSSKIKENNILKRNVEHNESFYDHYSANRCKENFVENVESNVSCAVDVCGLKSDENITDLSKNIAFNTFDSKNIQSNNHSKFTSLASSTISGLSSVNTKNISTIPSSSSCATSHFDSVSWHRDCQMMILACTAWLPTIASLHLVTLLGILFAVISVIAVFII